jgi:hypothetical protein
MVLVYGLEWGGTVAAGRWLGAVVATAACLTDGRALVIRWSDTEEDGHPAAEEDDVV